MNRGEIPDSFRLTLLRILSGYTPPEEDTTLFVVLSVEALDPEWLLVQLADQRYPLARRIEVLYNTSSTFERGLNILLREDITLEQIRRR